ncbi:AraC family ligand binding domain-containing protein [Uliginosibacterium paludis]|uniref:AraC family transcriptional regulator n=1 Tax=Uliginosibacterium paludis TaxID=1615952 RepID=A0ABV2CTB7_9RHOO
MTDRVRYHRFADAPGFVLGDARLAGRAFGPHYHLDYHIGVLDHGVQAQHFGGTTHLLAPGAVSFMPPGEVHDGAGSDEGFRLRTFRIAPDFLLPLCSEIAGRDGVPAQSGVILENPRLARQLRCLHEALGGQQETVTLAAQSGLIEVFAGLMEASGEHPGPEPVAGALGDAECRRVHDYCMSRLAERITLEDLAVLCGMSRFQFLRRFSRRFGLTPHNWLIRLRLERACHLLARGGRTVAELAQELGFYDQSHFTRCFRAAFGVAPTRY